MPQNILFFLIAVTAVSLFAGAIVGYYVRQSIVKKRKGTIEAKLHKKVEQVKLEAQEILDKARQKSSQLVSETQRETDIRRKELLKTEEILFKRESSLDDKLSSFEEKEKDFTSKVEKLKEVKERISRLEEEAQQKIEKVAGMSTKEAKEEVLKRVEDESEKDILERIHKLKQEGEDRYQLRAKEILTLTVQRYGLSQAQETTTSTLHLPSDEVKGRIIGKEGRNIKAFEKLTGVEVIVDDTPETVIISGFSPIRRHVAKVVLERLIKDGRIQPAKIEEQVQKAEEEVKAQMKEFGEKAVYDTGIIDLPAKIVELLGRLYFRTSYGQNVLLHSIEVAHLSAMLAEELGLDSALAKKAGLLHDIGKAVDHQVQGSHVEIGIKILKKFEQPEAVIQAMKSHHGDYEPEILEATIVQTADQLSGARPGARKDTVENYMQRLKELEDLALDFPGVSLAYAIQAGREIRVFVRPEEVGDLEAYKLARDITNKIQQELNYPGEIKVVVIRETRVVEYAK
ncbi:MAG: ribonuclease Y [bacterium]|nr:ribonuclease Y [bacterium]